MNSVDGPVQLEPETVARLDRQLSDCRHNVNNSLSMITAAIELLRYKPESAQRVLQAALDHTGRIAGELRVFSTEFEQTLGINRSAEDVRQRTDNEPGEPL